MAVNSRRKGKTGELELAKRLTDLGYPARRGQQFRGGAESPDVVCEKLAHIHFEVKRMADCKMFSPAALKEWSAQARADAGAEKQPVLVHRWNGQSTWWVCVLPVGITTGHLRPYWQTLEDWLGDVP